MSNSVANQAGKPKQALMVWGGWDGHQPKETTEFFAGFLRKSGFTVTISTTLDSYLDKDLMAKVDLIVPSWTCGSITGDQANGLISTVRAGAGIAGWHGGIADAFRGNIEYQNMIGGQFLSHPGGCIDYNVTVTGWEDGIMDGIASFTMKNTEQYYMMMDPAVRVLATTTFTGGHAGHDEGTVMPVVWKRRWGQGRVFVSAIGHVLKDYENNASARTIMERGLLWASR